MRILAAIVGLALSGAALAQSTPPTRPVVVTEIARVSGAWSLAFPPEGGILIGLQGGHLRHAHDIDASIGAARDLNGGPADVLDVGPFDVALDPADSRAFVACYARRLGGDLVTVSVAFGRYDLAAGRVTEWRRVFDQEPALPMGPTADQREGRYLGCRVAWDGDAVIAALGARRGEPARESLEGTLGRSIRVARDGAWTTLTTGHRNPQGLVVGANGVVYETEHGPKGGDEVNILVRGQDYGWPTVGHGLGYDQRPAMRATSAPGATDPIWYWTPSIAPSGLAFYDGSLFPEWRGGLLAGGLASRALHRLELRDGHVVGEERLLVDLGERIRDVRQGPDGAVYVLTDGTGRLLRLTPAPAGQHSDIY